MKKKLGLLLIIILILAAHFSGLFEYLNFSELKNRQLELQNLYQTNPFLFIGSYFLIYVVSTALSLPGATILTLAAGAIFGLVTGLVLVSFASTIGATLAFVSTRYLLRDSIEKKFSSQLESINKGITKEGAFYLFTLRLVPAFPFFLINMVMGLTKMKALTFALVSQLGMLLGTLVYVNAGTQIAKLDSASGILSPPLILSFILLGFLPLIAKKAVDWFKARKVYKNFKRPASFDYNIVAIGAGAGGLVTTYIASAVKAKSVLIEKSKMGGDCLNTGCVPSKAIIASAKLKHSLSKANEHGIVADNSEVDFSQVMKRIQTIINKIAPHDSVQRYTELGVECVQGEAEILSPWEVKVGEKIFKTKNIVLATGATPVVPKIPGVELVKIRTSENLWAMEKLPARFVIIGGGPIGCEMAQAFQRLGSQVFLVEGGAQLLSREDGDVSKLIHEKFIAERVKVFTEHKALRIELEGNEKVLITEHLGSEIKIAFDEILFALGRKANTEIPGLDKLQLDLAPQGTFEHDEYMRTKYPNIFVCGDCAGPYQFTHTAAHQAWYAAVNALFGPFKMFKADYRVIPWTTFTSPEVARVGLNESDALKAKIDFEITIYRLDDLDRAIADGEEQGFVKVITKKGSDKILGATIVSAHGGELLAEFVLAMKYGLGMNKILGTIHSYPTFSEANKYAAGVWKKNHQPERLLKFVRKFHEWRRG